MTPAEHEARIDMAERHMLEANNRIDRTLFAHAFLQAITERNAERTPDQVAELERTRGLR
jgi:hypothetical protein